MGEPNRSPNQLGFFNRLLGAWTRLGRSPSVIDPTHSTFLNQTASQLRTRYCKPSVVRCFSIPRGRKLDFHDAICCLVRAVGQTTSSRTPQP
jgi:hypothetical protein